MRYLRIIPFFCAPFGCDCAAAHVACCHFSRTNRIDAQPVTRAVKCNRWLETPLFLALSCCLPFVLSGCLGGQLISNAAGADSGSLQALPTSIAFGAVSSGQTASSIVSIVNERSAAVQVSQIEVTGQPFSASLTSDLPITVPAGGTFSFNVNFTPTAMGPATGELTVISNSPTGGTLVIGLSGTGTAAGTANTAALSLLSCALASMTRAGTDTCTVSLSAAASASGFAVSLASNHSAVTVPASVTVAAGATTASFTATVSAVNTGEAVTLTASANSVAKTFALQLNAGVPTLRALSCAVASMTGAGSDNCTVSLNAAAPTGGVTISLASNNSAVTVPATLTMPAGAKSVIFAAKITAVGAAQTARLTATAGGVSEEFSVQLNVGAVGLSINATSIAFGTVQANTEVTQSVELTASGALPIAITAVTVQGTGFSISGAIFPLTLTGGQMATIEVTFDPTSAGATTGLLTILSTSLTSGAAVINLSGTGELDEVNLTWDAPTSSPDPVAGYNVYRAPSSSTSYQLLSSVSSSELAYIDSNVEAGQTYDYIVESVNASGVASAPSNMASVTLP